MSVAAQAGTHRSKLSAAARRAPAFAGVVLKTGVVLKKGGAMASEAKLLVVQFLRWVEARPRRVAEARAAWSSTGPLNCAWEDALADNMVALSRDGEVVLTSFGRARLECEP